METIINAKDINKYYRMGEIDIHVLKGLSFDIYEGEFVVILGHSGSGKSTLLNILGGIDKMTSGELLYRDIKLHNISDKDLTYFRREHVGFVFQFYNLIPTLTARENIELAQEISNAPYDCDELMELTGLTEFANHFPSQLSGGQQQRVAISRALAKNPNLLLCDEPTGALDINTGIEVLETLIRFNKRYNKTIILITHNSEIGNIADRAFYLKDGLIERITENANPLSAGEVSW